MKDYDHMTTMDENMNWMKQAHLLSILISTIEGPLLYIYLYFKRSQ